MCIVPVDGSLQSFRQRRIHYIGQHLPKLVIPKALGGRSRIACSVKVNCLKIVTYMRADTLRILADAELYAFTDVYQVIIANINQRNGNAREVIYKQQFAPLITVTPQDDRFSVQFAT